MPYHTENMAISFMTQVFNSLFLGKLVSVQCAACLAIMETSRECNRTQTHNHLARKQTLNYLENINN